MSICVEKIVHKGCGSNALQVFQDDEGNINGWCFACGTYVEDPYDGAVGGPPKSIRKKSLEEIEAELEDIGGYRGAVNLPARKLKEEYLKYFGYRIGVSEVDGDTPEVLYRPYYGEEGFLGFKAKVMSTKQSWWIKRPGDPLPFGWHQAVDTGAKRLFITEGEEDAVALFQVIKEQAKGSKYETYNPAVISLSHGAASAVKTLARMQGQIRKNFKEIVLVFDQDKPGRDAASAVCREVFPDAIVAELPAKDANACLVEGRSKALHSACVFKAEKPKNTRIVWGADLHEAANKPAEFGVSWPWEKLTEMTRGIRTKEVHYLGAGQKMGKSEVVDAIADHLMRVHNWPVLMAKPEQSNLMTYKKVAGKAVGRIFHDPKIEFDSEAYERAGKLIGNRLAMLDLYQHLGWETLKQDIRSAASAGVKAAFIDPITNLTNGINAGDANAKLQEIAQELSAMALDLDIVVFVMCHLRNPESGPEHTLGGRVLASQFAGSRAMSRSCNYLWGIEGNKDPYLPEEQRNIREIVLIEDREFGEAGSCQLYWDRQTGLFNEVG